MAPQGMAPQGMAPQGMAPQGYQQQFGGFNTQGGPPRPPMPSGPGMGVGGPNMGAIAQYIAMSQGATPQGNNFGPRAPMGGNNFGLRGQSYGPTRGGFNQNNRGGGWNNPMGGNYQNY